MRGEKHMQSIQQPKWELFGESHELLFILNQLPYKLPFLLPRGLATWETLLLEDNEPEIWYFLWEVGLTYQGETTKPSRTSQMRNSNDKHISSSYLLPWMTMKSNQHQLSTYCTPVWAPVTANTHSKYSVDVGCTIHAGRVRWHPQTSMWIGT